MAGRVEALVKPSLLVWARRTAGYKTVEAAAQRARLKTEQLESWEQGESRPTVNQLRHLGQVYSRPLAVFYLPEPPRDFEALRLRDYRRLPDATVPDESPELRAEIRRALYRREIFLELADDWEDTPPELEASASMREKPERVGARIRDLLGISTEEQIGWASEYEALNNWRFALEGAGVLVFQASGIDIDEMRGFSLTDRPFPVVVVNIRDRPRARIFSLMHEFTHILLRDSGLCDLVERENRPSAEQRVERFCNSVAAAALVPKDDLLAQPMVARKPDRSAAWSWDEIREMASRYEVSDQALLGRLRTLDKIDEGFYWQTARTFQRRYDKSKVRTSRGPAPPEKVVNNAGQLFTSLVLESYHDARISAVDLSDYLDVRLKHIPSIEGLVREKTALYR